MHQQQSEEKSLFRDTPQCSFREALLAFIKRVKPLSPCTCIGRFVEKKQKLGDGNLLKTERGGKLKEIAGLSAADYADRSARQLQTQIYTKCMEGLRAGSLARVRPLTSAAGRATITFLPEGRTLTLEKFKYALESWRQTPAFVGFPSAQLFH
jgi:hypothetical protein